MHVALTDYWSMMQKGAFWALNKGIALDASKKPKEKAKAAEYFQASADLYEKVLNSTNPKFPGEQSWATATYKNVGIAYGRLQHVPENSAKMAVAFEIYLARSEASVDPADQRFEMHRCELQRDCVCGCRCRCVSAASECALRRVMSCACAGWSPVTARR